MGQLAAGLQQEQSLRDAGFGDDEVNKWRADTVQHLSAGGFSGQEVSDYFGIKEPDMSPMKQYVQKNLAQFNESQKPQLPTGETSAQDPTPDKTPHPADSMLQALEAGFQMSVTGLVKRNELPDTILPEHADMAMRIASQVGQLSGDLPAMVAGGFFGGMAGGPAAPITGAAGAWAAPAAIRTAYIQHLQKGDIKDFGDFWERSSAVLMEAAKSGAVGAATAGVGGAAAGVLGETALSPMVQTSGKLAAELGTMTTVGKAMEGQMPKAQDFVDGAILLGGLHGAVSVAGELPSFGKNLQTKLQDIYAKTGIKPDQIYNEAQSNPILKQEILSDSPNLPHSLRDAVEERQPGQEIFDGHTAQSVKAEIPAKLGEQSDALGKGFAPDETAQIEKQAPVPSAKGGSEPPDLSDPKAAILDRIGTPKEESSSSWSDAYTRALDSMNPVKKLTEALTGERELSAKDDPYELLKFSKRSANRLELFVDHGPVDLKTGEATGTPALKEILKPFKGQWDDFKAYAVAQRAIELDGRGIETGVPIDQAKTYVEGNKGKFEEGFRSLVDWQNDSLKYLRDSGVLSSEGFDKITSQNQNYVPFSRISEEGTSKGGKSASNPVKNIYGSDLKIQDPIVSMIKNSYAYIKAAELNQAKSTLIDVWKNSSEGKDLIEKVAPTMRPISVSENEVPRMKEILDVMQAHGIEGDPESFNIFRPLSQPLSDSEIAVMRDGKREVYNVGEDVKTALEATNYQAPNLIMKTANAFSKAIRTGAVDLPDFLARHAIRDTANAFIYSKNGFVPVWDNLKGLGAYFKGGKEWEEFLAGGGGMSNFMSMDRDYLQPKIFELSKETGLIDKVKNLAKDPLSILKAAAEAVVTAPRLGEFMKAREAGKDIFEAGADARNVTLDNQRMGSDPAVKAISMITAFWNTRVQGLDRMVQAFQENPAQTAAKVGMAITLPSVLLWAKYHDDPRYQGAPQWEKDLFWMIPLDKWETASAMQATTMPDALKRIGANGQTEVNNGAMIRIPKPFEQGILFGSLPERMLESFYAKNPEGFKHFFQTVFEGAAPLPIPNAVAPAIEQFANRGLMTGGNIVPHSLETVAPEYQYTHYTSDTAKALGKIISYIPGVKDIGHANVTLSSPMVLENYIRSWTGGVGMYALQIADKGLQAAGISDAPQNKPASALSDIPFVKAFVVRYPSAGSQHIQDFYDNFEKTQTNFATIQHLRQSGDVRSLSSYLASPDAQENMLRLNGMQKAVSNQNTLIQKIYSNPTMTPNDKRQTIDGLYYQMIQAAKMGNQMMEAMKKEGSQK